MRVSVALGWEFLPFWPQGVLSWQIRPTGKSGEYVTPFPVLPEIARVAVWKIATEMNERNADEYYRRARL